MREEDTYTYIMPTKVYKKYTNGNLHFKIYIKYFQGNGRDRETDKKNI